MSDNNYNEKEFVKDEELASTIDKIIPLVAEMGESRFKCYMKAYLELKLNENKNIFFGKFLEYVEKCNEDKNGNRQMSIMSFKNFLLDMPSRGTATIRAKNSHKTVFPILDEL